VQTREREPDEGEEPELITPEDFLPHDPFPADARRLGFDQYSGAMIALAAGLDRRNPVHRAVALAMLVVFVTPVLMTVLFLLR
jgi:predicted esterase